MFKEKPYTFKQEHINPDAWNQRTYWYDKSGKQYKIKDMNYNHAFNSLKYIYKHYPNRIVSPLAEAMTRHCNDLKAKV